MFAARNSDPKALCRCCRLRCHHHITHEQMHRMQFALRCSNGPNAFKFRTKCDIPLTPRPPFCFPKQKALSRQLKLSQQLRIVAHYALTIARSSSVAMCVTTYNGYRLFPRLRPRPISPCKIPHLTARTMSFTPAPSRLHRGRLLPT